jgi:hypothetical protein
MKKLFLLLFFPLFYITAQTTSEIPKKRIIDWSEAGVLGKIPLHSKSDFININDFLGNDTTFDNALVKAIKTGEEEELKIIYFPAGNYPFNKPIKLKSNTVILGAGANKSHLIISLNGKRGNCISFNGKVIKTLNYDNKLKKGTKKIVLDMNIKNFKNAVIAEIYQGKNVYGKSSSGKEKQYQKGQVIKISEIDNNTLILQDSLRLDYPVKDKWGEPIKIKLIIPVTNSGIENISVKRKDRPPKNGSNIISFNYAYNCWLNGIASRMGANNHVSVNNSRNIEIRGSFFSSTFNTGGGGNGYGIVVGSNSTDCLFEDNIFEKLRHAMIIASSANGNVFGYNASFNKPLLNIDEASISVHGHYPYMNLFESNYVEYINVDYVWGANGEYNTFLRNYVYDKGLFGLFRNQELQIERGTDKTNIIGNLANVKARGKDNFILKNMPISQLTDAMFLETYSFYYNKKPDFIPASVSWPCFGLKTSKTGEEISNSIPAVLRYFTDNKTVTVKFN